MIPYKDDNPSRTFPGVTVALIAVNAGAFLFYRLQGERAYLAAIHELGLIPRELWAGNLPWSEAHPPLVSLFTSLFMHGGWLHLGGNMLYLWIFGDNVEDRMGHLRYLIFYLVCGIIASFGHIIFNLGSDIPLVGASGAIAGVLGAYAYLFPAARVRVLAFIFFFVTTIMVPAWFLLGFWFVLQLLNSLPAVGAVPTGGTAYLAHVAGFVAGLIYARQRFRRRFYRWRREKDWGDRW